MSKTQYIPAKLNGNELDNFVDVVCGLIKEKTNLFDEAPEAEEEFKKNLSQFLDPIQKKGLTLDLDNELQREAIPLASLAARSPSQKDNPEKLNLEDILFLFKKDPEKEESVDDLRMKMEKLFDKLNLNQEDRKKFSADFEKIINKLDDEKKDNEEKLDPEKSPLHKILIESLNKALREELSYPGTLANNFVAAAFTGIQSGNVLPLSAAAIQQIEASPSKTSEQEYLEKGLLHDLAPSSSVKLTLDHP